MGDSTPFMVLDQLTKANALRGKPNTDSKRKDARDAMILEWIESLPDDRKNMIKMYAQQMVDNYHYRVASRKALRNSDGYILATKPMGFSVNTAMVLLVTIAMQKDLDFSKKEK